MKDLHIRLAETHDYQAILAIYNEAIRTRMSTCDEDEQTMSSRAAWFAQFTAKHPLYVGICEGEVAGYTCLFPYNSKSGFRFAVEDSVYVASKFQGHRFGEKLLGFVLDRAREFGYSYVHASIFKHNTPSIKLHEKFGFKLLGTQTRIANLDGQWFDNCLLSLNL